VRVSDTTLLLSFSLGPRSPSPFFSLRRLRHSSVTPVSPILRPSFRRSLPIWHRNHAVPPIGQENPPFFPDTSFPPGWWMTFRPRDPFCSLMEGTLLVRIILSTRLLIRFPQISPPPLVLPHLFSCPKSFCLWFPPSSIIPSNHTATWSLRAPASFAV